MDAREWEKAILEFMNSDGWDDVPVNGEYLATAFPKILRYIEWLRANIAKDTE